MHISTEIRPALGSETQDRARMDGATGPGESDEGAVEYRDHRFTLDVRQRGEVWTAQHRLLDISPQQAWQAATAGRHQWTSMDPAWRTFNEARRNAIEAAHAAIDALYR